MIELRGGFPYLQKRKTPVAILRDVRLPREERFDRLEPPDLPSAVEEALEIAGDDVMTLPLLLRDEPLDRSPKGDRIVSELS